MSAWAATVVTVGAVVLFSTLGSFHWRLWWLVPLAWLVLFVPSLLLALAMSLQGRQGWAIRLPWVSLGVVSLAGLWVVVLGIDATLTRFALALLGATGLAAGIYGALAPVAEPRRPKVERRRNLTLRACTEELLDAIRTMHRVAVAVRGGSVSADEGQRSFHRLEEGLRELVGEIHRTAHGTPKDGGSR